MNLFSAFYSIENNNAYFLNPALFPVNVISC